MRMLRAAKPVCAGALGISPCRDGRVACLRVFGLVGMCSLWYTLATSALTPTNLQSLACHHPAAWCHQGIQAGRLPLRTCTCRWAEVWARLRELQSAAFPGLPRAALLAELVRAQLRCGCWRAARLHLAGRGASPLAPADAEALVVAAGREYFYAASSLDAPEVAQVLIKNHDLIK